MVIYYYHKIATVCTSIIVYDIILLHWKSVNKYNFIIQCFYKAVKCNFRYLRYKNDFKYQKKKLNQFLFVQMVIFN